MPVLETDEISVRFGGHMAVNSVSLAVAEGEISGLIGPNGAGKTTTFNVITGLQAPTHGSVRLDGRDITSVPAHKRARLGIARTFQRLELFGSLSVRDNVLTATEMHVRDHKEAQAAADRLLDAVGLGAAGDRRADELSTGSARQLELARAMACEPRVLLLDEPASGLDEAETERFAQILVGLAETGLALLIVEHDVPLVVRLCHQITVLNFGEVLAAGTPAEVQRDPAVIDAYLGQDPGAPG